MSLTVAFTLIVVLGLGVAWHIVKMTTDALKYRSDNEAESAITAAELRLLDDDQRETRIFTMS